MSSTIVTTATDSTVRRTTRLRITQRGRRVLTALVAVPLAAGIGFAAVSGGAAMATSDAVPTSFETITVLPGDTLWGIAEEVAPSTDPRTVVDDIMQVNGLRGASVQVGQELAIPAEYAS